jgi:hypothetical protein
MAHLLGNPHVSTARLNVNRDPAGQPDNIKYYKFSLTCRRFTDRRIFVFINPVEESMANKTNAQRLLDSLFKQIASEVARGVAQGLARSGLQKSIQALSRDIQKSHPAAKSRKSGRKRGRPKGKARTCSIKGCKLPARAKGLCSKHYQQKRYAQLKKKSAGKKVRQTRKK